MPSLSDQLASALPYEQYLATGNEEQQRRWTQVYDIAHLDVTQQQLVTSFQREMKILVHSGIWCGDCVEQCLLIQRIAAKPYYLRARPHTSTARRLALTIARFTTLPALHM
jgi:Thioredoxin